MPLNLTPRSANGEFVPYMKYNAKAGRWYSKNDDGTEFEVSPTFSAVYDFANIKTGWIEFVEGGAPDRVWDNGSMAPRPGPKHKRGFSLNLYSQKEIGGLRELSATSDIMIETIKDIYDNQYENAPEAAKGMLPVVKCEGVHPIKGSKSTNYKPTLRITKWVARPEGMKTAKVPPASADVPPPVIAAPQPAAPAAADDDGEEF